MITSLKIFFEAYKYLKECVRASIKQLDREHLRSLFNTLIEAKKKNSMIIVDGQGRSLQSVLIMEDCLEHNGFPIILPAHNANLRPWKPGDVFFFNSGSGSGSPLAHAKYAEEDGLKVLGMTYNSKIYDNFQNKEDGILILEPSKNRNSVYAPLGTEFEFTSAVLGASIGYGVGKDEDDSLKRFEESVATILNLFDRTYDYFENNLDGLIKFINLINEYIDPENKSHVYFMGVGRDVIINQVAAIRYGHLHKKMNGKVVKDLQVIYEGHWDLRKPKDLAIVTSGSGATPQTLSYATQAFITGMRIFGITSFKNSDLGRFSKRVDGCLVVPGRRDPFSMYNLVNVLRKHYLPEFELNVYLTMDSLLAQIAADHGIIEDDMKKAHRLHKLQ
ncbi:MAG: hypothetical protein ACTSRZ_15155 [Promethearchaeota archaeon]